ncbi:MAG: IS66 family insertion sequence element accessory protein TnpB [Desulfobacteraceae bacterium]|nr:IS66 family insertion sequence element accessory protein TnpB [Desulfobacteraceae bacterium]
MSERSKKTNKKRFQFWENHIAKWSQTGLSQNAYCRDNNLRPNQFTYWKNKFKEQNLPIEFVQVTSQPFEKAINGHCPNTLRLNIKSGFQIEIPDGFSQTTLEQVLQVVGQF